MKGLEVFLQIFKLHFWKVMTETFIKHNEFEQFGKFYFE